MLKILWFCFFVDTMYIKEYWHCDKKLAHKHALLEFWRIFTVPRVTAASC